MSALLQPPEPIFSPKKRRVEPIFTAEERSIFEPYKELYCSSTTPQAQTAILKDKILTDIFNYWATKGTEPKTGEEWAERIKVGTATHCKQLDIISLNRRLSSISRIAGALITSIKIQRCS